MGSLDTNITEHASPEHTNARFSNRPLLADPDRCGTTGARAVRCGIFLTINNWGSISPQRMKTDSTCLTLRQHRLLQLDVLHCRFRTLVAESASVIEEEEPKLKSIVERLMASKDDQLTTVMKREEGMVVKLRAKNRLLKEQLAESEREKLKLKEEVEEKIAAHHEVNMLLKASQLQVQALKSRFKGSELKAMEEDMNKIEHFEQVSWETLCWGWHTPNCEGVGGGRKERDDFHFPFL